MTAKLKNDALRVIKRLRCYGTDAEDNLGCGDAVQVPRCGRGLRH